jgi:hypothetical protein
MLEILGSLVAASSKYVSRLTGNENERENRVAYHWAWSTRSSLWWRRRIDDDVGGASRCYNAAPDRVVLGFVCWWGG